MSDDQKQDLWDRDLTFDGFLNAIESGYRFTREELRERIDGLRGMYDKGVLVWEDPEIPAAYALAHIKALDMLEEDGEKLLDLELNLKKECGLFDLVADENTELEEKLARLERENAELREDIQRLVSSPPNWRGSGRPRWSCVSEALSRGSGHGLNLCRAFGFDPGEVHPGNCEFDTDDYLSPEDPA